MNRKSKVQKKELPESCVLEISGVSDFGDYIAVTSEPSDNPLNIPIYVVENKRLKPALAVGDKFLANLSKRKDCYMAKPVMRLGNPNLPDEIIYGIVEKKEGKFYLKPSEKKDYMSYLLENDFGFKEGDFVKVALGGSRRFKQARVIKSYGAFALQKAASLLVLDKYNIPHEFPKEVIKETQNLPKFNKNVREDLTNIPLVTIDGDDAKDFDDAVYAMPTPDGFLLIVAIADVSFYVRPFSALDKEAYKRGNSVYLPDRVVPMLPEALCNDLCSLRPKEDRAAIACFIDIDKQGNIIQYDFKRAVIKSAARLTYKEVQNALEGKKSANIKEVYVKTIEPIYRAYLALRMAREKRGALNLESNEYKIRFNDKGEVVAIEKEESLEANKMIEEFMIAANICAAKALGKSKLPTMYRVHEKPLEEKLKDIEPLLHNLHLKLPDINALKPEHFNKILAMCSEDGYNAGVGELILRLQCQAKYSPHNLGHFGLGLEDYAHFTSPIRRYADLLVHRALVKAYKMPEGGELEDSASVKIFEETGEHLCVTERSAANAEREMTARYVSDYLLPMIGADFEVKVSGVSAAGVFAEIETIGAEGLIPMSSLPTDMYILNDGNMSLTGQRYGLSFHFGQKLQVRLLEASPITGGLIFKYIDPEEGVSYVEKGGRFFGGYKKVMAQKRAMKKEKPEKKAKKKKEKLPKKRRKQKIKDKNKLKQKRKKSNAK